jgi:hypothetical protein
MPTDASATVRALVAEIPVERLRELFIQFVCGGLVPSPAVAAAPTGDAAARKRERARQWIARKRRGRGRRRRRLLRLCALLLDR